MGTPVDSSGYPPPPGRAVSPEPQVISVEAQRDWLRRCFTQDGLKELEALVAMPGWSEIALRCDAFGRTPLHMVADYGWETAIKVLLEHRTDTTMRDARGNTALHLAAMSGVCGSALKGLCFHSDAARKNRVMDGRNDAGDTALHLAVMSRNAAAARNLVELHCNPFIVNNAGRCAMDAAERSDHPELVAIVATAVRQYLGSIALITLAGAGLSFACVSRARRVHFDVTPMALAARAKELRSQGKLRRGTVRSGTSSANSSPRGSAADDSAAVMSSVFSHEHSDCPDLTVRLPNAFSFIQSHRRARRRSRDFIGEGNLEITTSAVGAGSAAGSASGFLMPPPSPT